MPTFTVDSCTYRNGERPVVIYYIPQLKIQKIISVTRDGDIRCHWEDGMYSLSKEPGRLDLILTTPPPRPWSCAGDVPQEAEWVHTMRGPYPEHRRLCGVFDGGVLVGNELLDWKQFAVMNARWSATRTGEYVACTTTNPLTP